MTLGEKIRKRRKELGLTLKEVAPIVGISLQSLSDTERGNRNPRRPTLVAICKALSLDPDTLEPITHSAWDDLWANDMLLYCEGKSYLIPKHVLDKYKDDLKRIPAREE